MAFAGLRGILPGSHSISNAAGQVGHISHTKIVAAEYPCGDTGRSLPKSATAFERPPGGPPGLSKSGRVRTPAGALAGIGRPQVAAVGALQVDNSPLVAEQVLPMG